MIKASVVGAGGYAGGELLRILLLHPEAELVAVTDIQRIGERVDAVFPHLSGLTELCIEETDLEKLAAVSDVVFLALPHGQAMPTVQALAAAGKKVIDLGADFRFRDPAVYEAWYKVPHTAPELSKSACYGLPELNRAEVRQAQVIGNPGCYPTSAILALWPLLREGLLKTDTLIVDSKSGVSGAGRTPKTGNLYAECSGSIAAYGVAAHRHTPEIEQQLSLAAGEPLCINFTPHLTPMPRGILSTSYGTLKEGLAEPDLAAVYDAYYGKEYFIHLCRDGQYPATKWVAGSNFCYLGWKYDKRTRRVIVLSAIDNLVKGAAGQAVQNMNIMFGIEEQAGLRLAPLFP